MKKILVATLFLITLLFISLIYNDFINSSDNKGTNDEIIDKNDQNNKKEASGTYKESIHKYLAKTQSEIIKKFGEPNRIDPTAFGYEWWIYNKENERYMQVGIKDKKVVSIFVIGDNLNTEPFKIGEPSNNIFKNIPLEGAVSINYKDGNFRFELSEEEMVVRPLVAIGDNWAQLYFDKFTQKLSSIRYLTPEILIIQRPYNMSYRGDLIEPPTLTNEKWDQVERAEEKQILSLTNILRSRYNVQPVKWHEEAAKVAYGHSKEMYDKNYFSHTSPVAGDLANRLNNAGVMYSQAGENIAANYIDAAAAVEGWLNSEGHRKTMLDDVYTQLGIGVYQKYYTQNFIKP